MGRVRELMFDVAINDPDYLQWLCEVDAKIESGEIALSEFSADAESAASNYAGLADDDTAGINAANTELSNIKRNLKKDKPGHPRDRAAVAEILAHELAHVTQSDYVTGCSIDAESESSACACEHAGAYEKEIKFVLLYQALTCVDSEAFPLYTFHFLSEGYDDIHQKWLDARAACEAGKANGEHDLDPLGDLPGQPGTVGLPPTAAMLSCGELAAFIDELEPGSEGGWTGASDPDEDGDGNPCTTSEPSEGDD